MNDIILRGVIRNITPSHKIKDIEYDKAELVVNRADDKADIINIKFKKFSNIYKEDQQVELVGNVRSYSRQVSDNKNKVDIYVFTYFDKPEQPDDQELPNNRVNITGRICKIEPLRTTSTGKQNIHFIIANNLIIDDGSQKLNSYIPCIAWGRAARAIASLSVNQEIEITGELHSREYKKQLSDNDFEIRVAHELVVLDYTLLTQLD